MIVSCCADAKEDVGVDSVVFICYLNHIFHTVTHVGFHAGPSMYGFPECDRVRVVFTARFVKFVPASNRRFDGPNFSGCSNSLLIWEIRGEIVFEENAKGRVASTPSDDFA